jgi:hypothetical protein
VTGQVANLIEIDCPHWCDGGLSNIEEIDALHWVENDPANGFGNEEGRSRPFDGKRRWAPLRRAGWPRGIRGRS